MYKFFYNRTKTRICMNKSFIVIECKILTTHEKSKQTSLLAGQKYTTFYTLVWARTFDLVYGQNLLQLVFPQICKTCNLQVFFLLLFFLLVGSGPKRSMPIEKLGSSLLVSSILQREGKLHCSLTRQQLWSQFKKMLMSSYLHTGMRK